MYISAKFCYYVGDKFDIGSRIANLTILMIAIGDNQENQIGEARIKDLNFNKKKHICILQLDILDRNEINMALKPIPYFILNEIGSKMRDVKSN